MLAGEAGVLVALAVAGADAVGFFGEGVVVFLVGPVVARCGGGAGVVFVVALLSVLAEAAELVAEGGEAGLQAVVEGVDSGERGGAVLGEVGGVDGGGGVERVVEPRVGG